MTKIIDLYVRINKTYTYYWRENSNPFLNIKLLILRSNIINKYYNNYFIRFNLNY